MGWLDEQVAVLTGGGSGLGRALVDTLLEEGARVVVLEYSPDKCRALEAECDPGRVAVVQGDAGTYASNREAVDLAVARWGRLDTFIANAGLWDFSRSLDDMTPEELDRGFDELYRLNVKGPLLAAKAALEALRASNGSFIMTLSNAALYPGGGGSLYISSKHAGAGLVKQLAYELAPNVRVNGVAPAGMVSDLRGPASMGLADTSVSGLDMATMVAKKSALQRCPEAVDYTGAYVLLASRKYGITTSGSILDVANGKGLIGRVVDDLLA
ncbi:2,3-dihydroxy-2,3-dihydrophenylpropionate dehydrogenase [Raineyella antarctica]|uniref:2,3-dihydroxy-2,3-dihydrophenylpropionate dehydrogenase n=1 Tax=Raineyella antarctica TaxID=1577474 RepID=A0A1G6GF01_9ACTN|nr:SDR family NAD(P)-dependent oxidoreductase [Raineyella antarctica]SDB80581.1 2,3-dihydroxy-2,3-dihydrophenylpropionate dehydrogenase [Raineyella antarctica]